MSFREYLIKKGYNKEQADAACICIENDLPVWDPKIEDLYWNWFNIIILNKKERSKNGTDNATRSNNSSI